MATLRYTIAPPSVAPLLHEFGDWHLIPEAAWREFDAAMAYWARSRRMYADPPDETPKHKRRTRDISERKSPVTA
jgi:hypothetical protein